MSSIENIGQHRATWASDIRLLRKAYKKSSFSREIPLEELHARSPVKNLIYSVFYRHIQHIAEPDVPRQINPVLDSLLYTCRALVAFVAIPWNLGQPESAAEYSRHMGSITSVLLLLLTTISPSRPAVWCPPRRVWRFSLRMMQVWTYQTKLRFLGEHQSSPMPWSRTSREEILESHSKKPAFRIALHFAHISGNAH